LGPGGRRRPLAGAGPGPGAQAQLQAALCPLCLSLPTHGA